MEKIILNINKLGEDGNSIKIPMNNFFIPVDNYEVVQNEYIPDAILEGLNPVEDYEKKRFFPWNGINQIIIRLKQSGSTPLNYDDFGYSYDDLFFLRNSFKNSFIKLNFYDSPDPSNRRLAFQLIIYNQLNEDQRDPITKNLLAVNISPITYRIVDPIKIKTGISEGFYLYWLNNPPNNSYPIDFYMTATYQNALDGVITPLIAYDTPNIPINEFNAYNYVKYTLSSINGISQYKINMDSTMTGFDYRTISQVGSDLYIDFYIPDIL